MSSVATAILEQVDHLTEAECELIYEKLADRLHAGHEPDDALSEEMKDTLDRRWRKSSQATCKAFRMRP